MDGLSKIGSIQPPFMPATGSVLTKSSPAEAQQSFSSSLKQAINTLNSYQVESDHQTQAFASGKATNLHEVMISAQKASISLQTAVEVQRKAIDAYNEVMRMQV